MEKSKDRDACVARIVWVCRGVGLILACFYLVLAIQAYTWHPNVYVEHTNAPKSKTQLDPNAQAWRPAATSQDAVAHGRDLYHRLGCAVCHGVEGKGGVTNPNYEKGVFPQLDNISDRLFLRDAESHAAALEALKAGTALDADPDLDIPRLSAIASQYTNVVNIMLNGNPAAIKDTAGVSPIPMPAWKDKLSSDDVRDIITYLTSLQKFEESGEQE